MDYIKSEGVSRFMLRFLAIIPARGGSKGIPHKNMYKLGDQPLIVYTLQAALQAKYISSVFVSSDDNMILDIAQSYGVNTLKRPKDLASDSALTEPVIEHVITNIPNFIQCYDYIVLLQPTSPLRTANHIDEAIDFLLQSDASALISVKEVDNKFLKSFIINGNKFLQPVSNPLYPFSRRQDLPLLYMPNGAIYIVKAEEFLQTKKLYTSKTLPYIMDSMSSLDIDTLDDINKCEEYLRR